MGTDWQLLAAMWNLPSWTMPLIAGITALAAYPQIAPPDDCLSRTRELTFSLQENTRSLNDAVRRFHRDLDETIARSDRGVRAGRVVLTEGADTDLLNDDNSGLGPDAARKFLAFRSLATQSGPAADLKAIGDLILDTRRRLSESTVVVRDLLVVRVDQIEPRHDAELNTAHKQLLKARRAAEDATQKAFWEFPLSVEAAPEAAPAKEIDIALRRDRFAALPFHVAPRLRYTVISDEYCRMAITDSGGSDPQGRRVFYEEEWFQNVSAVTRLRWRVGVDPTTGRHLLIRRYQPIQRAGNLAEIYNQPDRDALWYSEGAPVEPAQR